MSMRLLKLSIGLGLLLIVCLLGTMPYVDRTVHVSNASKEINQYIGSWRSQNGTVLNLRRDGTGRSRSDKTNQIQYFKYRIRQGEFLVDYVAQPDEYIRRLRQAYSGFHTDHYKLQSVSESEFRLFDVASGVTAIFIRSEDDILAKSP